MNNIFDLAWLIPVLPLVGFLINGLGRNTLSKSMAGIIGCGSIFISFIISVLIFLQVYNGQTANLHYFDLINIDSLRIGFDFKIDQLTSIFLLVITGVGFLIHVYSTAYMHEENNADYAKYFAYLNLFVFFMLLLVLGANFLILFIGWEGVGLCSYLLIGYWYKNQDYTAAGKKAFVMNRIGDFGFLLALFWIIAKVGTLDFNTLFQASTLQHFSAFDYTGITMLLLLGATGKSAQIPLFTWLPDAMAGPTPVSALIHAATMVTAGIYMIARSNALYSHAPATMNVVAVVGLITLLVAATIALRQNDIKKVLAYSTVSQLGYMFLALGVGAYTGAIFHVMTHAFFKALLFLGAGSVIHGMHGAQDIRNMGSLKKWMPVTHITFLIGCIAIAGIPPFSGFFSKDEILVGVYSHNIIYWGLGVVGAILTAFYMFRLYMLTFQGSFRGTKEQEHHLHESPGAIKWPLILLAILSIIGGWIGIPEFIMHGGHKLSAFLAPIFKENATAPVHELSHSTEYMLMAISVVAALIGVLFAISKYKSYKASAEPEKHNVLDGKWYFDELYHGAVTTPINHISKALDTVVEPKGIDQIVNGTGKFINYFSRQLRWAQTGKVGNYILMMIGGLIILFIMQLFF